MLLVIINWIFILWAAGVSGTLVTDRLLRRPLVCGDSGELVQRLGSRLMTGTILLTVYAQIWSLFGGVSLSATLVLLIATLVGSLVLLLRLKRTSDKATVKSAAKVCLHSARFLAALVIFLLLAYGSTHGIEHYDTGLYHAQAIRWIETYGSAPGLGNLHVRLAYNSAFLPLTALFSWSFLPLWNGGSSLHVMSGWMAFLLALAVMERDTKPQPEGEGQHDQSSTASAIRLSDICRILAGYYLFTAFTGISSPATDIPVFCCMLILLIRMTQLLERGDQNLSSWMFVSVLAVYAVTIKLSAGMFLLVVLIPVLALIRNGGRERCNACLRFLLSYLGCSLVVALPFFLRNVILSGWLVYPVTALDFFDLPWKIPKGTALYDSHEITAFGRGYFSVLDYDRPMSEWVPNWLGGLGRSNQLMLVLALSAFPFWLYEAIRKRRREAASAMILYAALLFWFLSAPLVRYGWIFIWMPAVLSLGLLLQTAEKWSGAWGRRFFSTGMMGLLVLLLLYKGVRLLQEDHPWTRPAGELAQLMVEPQAYRSFETETFEAGGLTFYAPTEGDQAGYDPFPSVPAKKEIHPRGTGFADGFLP